MVRDGVVDEARDPDQPAAVPTGWPGWLLNVLAVVSAGGAYVLAAVAAGTTGTGRVLLLAAGGVLAAGVVATQLVKQRRDAQQVRKAREIAKEAQTTFGTALSGALSPITSHLTEMAATSDRLSRTAVAGKLTQVVTVAAVSLTHPAARSAFYRYRRADRVLVRDAYFGRVAIPREAFASGTPDGDAVLDLVERGDQVFIDDVGTNAMVTPSRPGDYGTVIAVAVASPSDRFGVLTLDAPETGDLSEAHAELLRVLANLLGAGLALEVPGGSDPADVGPDARLGTEVDGRGAP